MELINNINITDKQKTKLNQLIEDAIKKTEQKKIQSFLKTKERKNKNNKITYELRKKDAFFCECCNKTVDKYYITKHNETKSHIANMEKHLSETNIYANNC